MTTYKKSSWITGTLCISLDRQRLKMLGPFHMLQPALVMTPIFQSTASHQTIKRCTGGLAIGRRITCAHWIWITCAHRSWVWWGKGDGNVRVWLELGAPILMSSMHRCRPQTYWVSTLLYSTFLSFFSLLCIVKSP